MKGWCLMIQTKNLLCRSKLLEQSRHYSKALKRKPLRIVKNKEVHYERAAKISPANIAQSHNVNDEGVVQGRTYMKLKAVDDHLGKLITAAKSQKLRKENSVILLEGSRLITDAIKAGADLKAIYFDDKKKLEEIPVKKTACNLYKIKHYDMKRWSDVVTPPGVMAICRMPQPGEDPVSTTASLCLPLSVICDNIRDPGNMGTLIRSAAAASCQKIYTTPGCVDIWDPKVIRSAMGAHFHITILPNIPWYLLPNYFNQETSFYLADLSPAAAATASDADAAADNDADDADDADNDIVESLFETQFSDGDIAVVIGGETHGVSRQAKHLTKMLSGRICQRVSIPMMPQIDSLNAGVAGSVLLYEIKRQMSHKS